MEKDRTAPERSFSLLIHLWSWSNPNCIILMSGQVFSRKYVPLPWINYNSKGKHRHRLRTCFCNIRLGTQWRFLNIRFLAYITYTRNSYKHLQQIQLHITVPPANTIFYIKCIKDIDPPLASTQTLPPGAPFVYFLFFLFKLFQTQWDDLEREL